MLKQEYLETLQNVKDELTTLINWVEEKEDDEEINRPWQATTIVFAIWKAQEDQGME